MTKPFSEELSSWLRGKQPKTIQSLNEVFAERAYAVIILVLMFFPALPLPTAGFTHVFEIIVMLLGLEMIIGQSPLWLPKSWRQKSLGPKARTKVLPAMIRFIRFFERFSRPRLRDLLQDHNVNRLFGLIFLVLALSAFVAPILFDTLPGMAAVLIALSILLGDVVLFVLGLSLGAVGVGMVVAAGSLTVELVRHLF